MRISIETPPPENYQTFDEWYRNSHGVDITGKRARADYGEWLFEQLQKGRPTTNPPPEVESYETWFKRMRRLDPRTHEPITMRSEFPHWFVGEENRLPEEARPSGRPAEPVKPRSETAPPSSYARRILTGAAAVASRLGQVGSMIRGALPVLGAVSTVLQAIREGQEMSKQPDRPGELHASSRKPGSPGGPSVG